jgi:hypothetical protein
MLFADGLAGLPTPGAAAPLLEFPRQKAYRAMLDSTVLPTAPPSASPTTTVQYHHFLPVGVCAGGPTKQLHASPLPSSFVHSRHLALHKRKCRPLSRLRYRTIDDLTGNGRGQAREGGPNQYSPFPNRR